MTHSRAVPDHQYETPFADAIRTLARHDWQRLHVPAHAGRPENAPGVADLVGATGLALDFPMLTTDIDQDTWRFVTPGRTPPIERSQALAAEAWGAHRVWFLTNGASGGNHIATTVVRGLGRAVLVQRSVHSSVIDALARTPLVTHFVPGEVDAGLGAAHGVTARAVANALVAHPDAAAVYLVSPSYFGAVADIAAIADLAHAHGLPLIVDEAWGSHFGMHPGLPLNAVRLGADLVISSTHKGGGSLTQSAMLQLGTGEQARRIESLVERVVLSFQSTSMSALLLASLDEARHGLVTRTERIGQTLEAAARLRTLLRRDRRFRDARADILASPDAIAVDPLKVVIDTRGAGIAGDHAEYLLIRDHRIGAELATASALLLLLGATSPPDVDRFWAALTALPDLGETASPPRALPSVGPKVRELGEAYFAPTETVPAIAAAGRISSDALAAYPPGVPNVVPGEVLTAQVIDFLRATAASPTGYVRGAVNPELSLFRVVATP